MSVVRAVLFDLDGTLADTAPDLGGALNLLLAEIGAPAVPLAVSRPLTSSGARGMLKAGLGLVPEPVGLDDFGMGPESLAEALRRSARAVIVTPRAQNPTHELVAPER